MDDVARGFAEQMIGRAARAVYAALPSVLGAGLPCAPGAGGA